MFAMRPFGFLAVALVSACYRAPSPAQLCGITCTKDCPDGLTCEQGYCVEPGQVCDPSYVYVAAGTTFACGIDDSNALWCWGSNAYHQIAPDNRATYPLATHVGTKSWRMVDAGGNHVCAIDDAGALYCWGENDRGQASPASGDVTEPRLIAVAGGPATWSTVSVGWKYTCAIGEGRLYCWGGNQDGVLGIGTQEDAPPTQVMPSKSDWTSVAALRSHTCAISTGGVFCWGAGSNGELGPTTSNSSSPVPVALNGKATSIAVTASSTCAVIEDGTLWCWGQNNAGELGEANLGLARTSNPTMATQSMGWKTIDGGQYQFCGIRNDELVCWGSAARGGLGGGLWDDNRSWHVVGTDATHVSVGFNYDFNVVSMRDDAFHDLSCGVFGSEIRCWGDDRYGQLGNGGTTLAETPTEITGLALQALAAGNEHACGISGGRLYCWGSTLLGAATGNATGGGTPCTTQVECDVGRPKQVMVSPTVDAVNAGEDFTCQLAGGEIRCWGNDDFVQLGQSSVGPRPQLVTAPMGLPWSELVTTRGRGQCARLGPSKQGYCWGLVPFTGMSSQPTRQTVVDGMKQIAVGFDFFCILDANGMLLCQGNNSGNQFGDGTTTGSQSLISLGRMYTAIASNPRARHVCGLRPDNQHVECWGQNSHGQTSGLPPQNTPVPLDVGLTSCTAVSTMGLASCAICDNGAHVYCWGDHSRGQLGFGPAIDTPVTQPREVALPPGITYVQLVAGSSYTCARTDIGRVFCWGYAPHGGLGNGGLPANLPSKVWSVAPR